MTRHFRDTETQFLADTERTLGNLKMTKLTPAIIAKGRKRNGPHARRD
jgi:hypothetical protein